VDTAAVHSPGLEQLRKAFRAAGSKAFDNHMKKVHQRLAQMVVDASKPGIAAESNRAAGAVTAIKSAVGGRIRLDATAAPMLPGIVFGAYQGRPRVGPTGRQFTGYNQFPSYDGTPRHIWPEVDELREKIADLHIEAIDSFLDSQGVPQ